jgi:uncharacterized repeat protein (TIGR03803 family)
MKQSVGLGLLLLGIAACSRLAAPNALPLGADAASHATRNSSSGYKTLFSFNGTDGSEPLANLIEVNGVLYGTTKLGGKYNQGTVFSVSPSGSEQVVHDFEGYPNDGGYPEAGLIAVKGVLYGTTLSGGPNFKSHGCSISYRSRDEDGCGTLFKVSRSGKENMLYSFGENGNIDFPSSGNLILVGGALYGTTWGAFTADRGTVYVSSTTGDVSLVYGFKGYPNDGQYPHAPLSLAKNGLMYGTTWTGGSGNCKIFHGSRGCGTVFYVSASGVERVVYNFQGQSDAAYPQAGLIAEGGTLYGTTQSGGNKNRAAKHCGDGCGTVFALTTSGAESVLYKFLGTSDGANPDAGLISVGGTLYGTTSNGGGGSDSGTVFAVTTQGSESVLHRFGQGSDGKDPSAGLLNVNGTLYGTTASGGAYGDGTVFALTP